MSRPASARVVSSWSWSSGAVVGAALAALAACSQPEAVVGDGVYRPVVISHLEPIDALDVLFVIDDSGSMADDQAALVEAARAHLFPQLEALPYGLPDLHVGVVSTDLGNGGGPNLPGCTGAGDDGALLIRAECPGIADRWLSDAPGVGGARVRNYPGTLDDAFGCIAQLGPSGCGFEQPLGALRRALDPANLANTGFLRPDALLLVVLVGDEDDCTVVDPTMFGDPMATVASALGPRTSFRCFEFGVTCAEPEDRAAGARTGCVPTDDSPYVAALGPLVDAVIAAKGGDRSKVMVTGVFGDDQPIEVVLQDNGIEPAPALGVQCTVDTAITAYPAVRLQAFAREFPARFLLPGVCASGMARTVDRIGAAVGDVLAGGTCLLGEPQQPLQCRASAIAAGGATRALPVCAGTGCVAIAPSVACGATGHHLRAAVEPGLLAAGETLQVDCVAAP